MRKILLAALIACVIFSTLAVPALAEPQAAPAAMPAVAAPQLDWSELAPDGELLPSAVNADSAILIDVKTGAVLFEKDADEKRYPASTTKIMTCLVALENCKDLSAVVKIGTLPKEDFINNSENIDLKKGEVFTLEQLLYVMMVYSGNDVADAVAQYIGKGSIKQFVSMMNQKAQSLGMADTHYTNPNGLADDTDHYTTARDMTKLAAAAMKYSDFTKMVSTAKYTLGATNKHKEMRTWSTTNYLLRDEEDGKYPGTYYAYANGIKTGATTMAGNALVSSAELNGVSLIGVVMHDNPRKYIFSDSITLFEYGFKFYDTVDLVPLLSDIPFSLDVKNAEKSDPEMGKLALLPKPSANNVYITDRADVIASIRNDPSSLIHWQLAITKDTAPIANNEKLGTVTFSYKDTALLTCDLLAARAVKEIILTPSPAPTPTPITSTGKVTPVSNPPSPSTNNAAKSSGMSSFLIWLGAIIVLLGLMMATIRIINTRRRNRKYRPNNLSRSDSSRPR